MSWRKGIAKHSKFRNVYGEPYRKDRCYENVKFSKNAWDGTYCSANPKYLAVVLDTSGGGGALLVIPLEKVGHQKIDNPKITGHQRQILDIQWNPFNDHIVASASEDTTVKIWRIPSGGLTEDLLEPLVDLRGHQRKVGVIRWHPSANGIIASAGFDYRVIVWNALKAKAIYTVDGHRDTIYDLAFNFNGSMMATTSKDKKIRVIDAHTGKVKQTFDGHESPKTSHLAFTDKTGDRIITTGFSSNGDREVALWDYNNPSSAIHIDSLDNSSSNLMLYYDMDIHVAYTAGKGDGMIAYFEVREEEPYLMRLSEYRHAAPQKTLGKMCKRGLDANRCEVFRFYKLHPNNWIEPLPMICPRRSDDFQEDLYPPTASMIPSLTAEEWISGQNKDPVLMSIKDGISRSNSPTSPTSGASSAEKYNSMFTRPAKFEKQLSTDAVISNDVNHSTDGPPSSSLISKTTTQEVHSSVDDEEHHKVKTLCEERGQEIEVLKRTISTKDQHIAKLEQDLTRRNIELSDMKTQFSKNMAELREANSKLAASRAQKDLDTSDGRTVRAETTFTKTSQTSVQSIPERPVKQVIQESIVSTKRSHNQFDDHAINRALEDAHNEPTRTTTPYESPRRQAHQTLGNGTPGSSTLGSSTLGGQATGTKTRESSSEDYGIEDIEAELESLREDLARTREARHDGGKSNVRYISEEPSPRQSDNRGAKTESGSTTSDVFTPRSSGYSGASGNYDGGPTSPDDKRMIITTASYARVPKHETSEASFERQTSPKDKKSYL